MPHPLARPVDRVEGSRGKIARGERVGPRRIRQGDELQELCRRLNSAIARLRREGDAHSDAYLSLVGVDVDSVDALLASAPSADSLSE